MKVVLDTNILIDYLLGVKTARKLLEQHKDAGISIISWMEVMIGGPDSDQESATKLRSFLSSFKTLPVTQASAEIAVELRKEYRIKLPDAIIWATARDQSANLVTRNTRDFKAHYPGIQIPYKLK